MRVNVLNAVTTVSLESLSSLAFLQCPVDRPSWSLPLRWTRTVSLKSPPKIVLLAAKHLSVSILLVDIKSKDRQIPFQASPTLLDVFPVLRSIR